MSWLTEPWQYEFFRTGLVAAVLVGLLCACVGCHVVLRRMSFLGDGLSHAVLPGLVLAHATGWPLWSGALGAALAAVAGIGWAGRRQRMSEDSAIGVLYTAMFAVGVVLMQRMGSFRSLTDILFGNVLGVSPGDLWVLAALVALVGATLWLLHKELELVMVDPQQAQVSGIRPGRLRAVLLVLLAVTIVTAIQMVGVLLTSALLVTPAAAARLLTRRLRTMMALAAVVAVGAGVLGLYASYYWGLPSGAAIVLLCALGFGGARLLAHLRRRRQGAA